MMSHKSRLTNCALIGLMLFTLVLLATLLCCYPWRHGLSGRYYDHPDWKGDPLLTVIDAELSRQTLHERGTKLPHNIYTVAWTGTINIPVTGFYTFAADSDAGTWLWIDDIPVIDGDGVRDREKRQGTIHLRQGGHRISVWYRHAGGFAELELWWQPEGAERTRLPPTILAPTDIITRLWLYHTARALLPWLIGCWASAFMGLAVIVYVRAHVPLWMIPPILLHHLWIEPIGWASEQIKKPRIWYWLMVISYVAIIFLTLSYARTFSTQMMARWGENIFSTVTTVLLTVIGIGILIYFGRLRQGRVARLLLFIGIAAIYVYFLSPAVREHLDTWSEGLHNVSAVLANRGMFPITSSEKVHFLEYGLLGMLLCKALSYYIRNKLAYLVATLGVYIVGVVDEGIQWALPNRVGDYRDLWLNLLSGVLAILMVALVIRPRIFQRYFRRTAVRPVCATLATAGVLTGIFLQVVNGFGTWIALPEHGARFVSAFTEDRLLALDQRYDQRSAGQPVEEIPPLTRRVYEYEANNHEYFRNWYDQRQRFFESSCEQVILTRYFRGYLRHKRVALLEYDPAQLPVMSQFDGQITYSSRAQAMVIIAFNARMMWSVILGSVVALSIVFIVVGKDTKGK